MIIFYISSDKLLMKCINTMKAELSLKDNCVSYIIKLWEKRFH